MSDTQIDTVSALIIGLEASAIAWGVCQPPGYDISTAIGLRAYTGLQTARKALMAHTAQMRNDVERIGNELATMRAANAELQARLIAATPARDYADDLVNDSEVML